MHCLPPFCVYVLFFSDEKNYTSISIFAGENGDFVAAAEYCNDVAVVRIFRDILAARFRDR